MYIGTVIEPDGEPFNDVTVNLSMENGFFVSNNTEGFINGNVSGDFVKQLKDMGVIKETFGKVRCNYGYYEYVSFDMDVLKEYDPVGVEEYLSLSDLSI